MIRPTRRINSRTHISMTQLTDPADDVRSRMARALVGQAVSLLVAPEIIAKGVVTDVLPDVDAPKIVVHGSKYTFNQVLTSVPASFCY